MECQCLEVSNIVKFTAVEGEMINNNINVYADRMWHSDHDDSQYFINQYYLQIPQIMPKYN